MCGNGAGGREGLDAGRARATKKESVAESDCDGIEVRGRVGGRVEIANWEILVELGCDGGVKGGSGGRVGAAILEVEGETGFDCFGGFVGACGVTR